MEPTSFGHMWKPNTRAKPSILTASSVTKKVRGPAMRKWQYPVWVLDYTSQDMGSTRVASRTRRWMKREGKTGYLYPPDTVFWEDYPRRTVRVVRTSYLLFLGGESCGLSKLVDAKLRFARFVDPELELGTRIDEIARIGQKEGDMGFWKAQSQFCLLVDLLLRSEPVDPQSRLIRRAPPGESSSDLVRAANAYLAKNLARSVDLSDVARHLRVSVSTLSHRYREETGESPMAHLLRMRVDLSKTLILRGEPLKSIAKATGFSDAFHLSKTFKRLEGVSPKAYLKGLRRSS